MAQPYTLEYFKDLEEGSLRSARVVVPQVLELISPKSVIDFGCGSGAWLQVYREHGIEDICGVDGDYINRDMLLFPADLFIARDLRKPIDLNRTFDLAVSLEVGEHLPSECAQTYIATLVRHSPIILFSAAIPNQPGNDHINTQWPDYWADIFAAHGYVPVDYLRQGIWIDPDVEYWYSQNLLIFTTPSCLETHPMLRSVAGRTTDMPLRLVHPKQYQHYIRIAQGYEGKISELELKTYELEQRVAERDHVLLERDVECARLEELAREQVNQLRASTARHEKIQRQLQDQIDLTTSVLRERDAQIEQLEQAPPRRIIMRGIRQLVLPLSSHRYAMYARLRTRRDLTSQGQASYTTSGTLQLDQNGKGYSMPFAGRTVPITGDADSYRPGLPQDFAGKLFDVPAQMEMSERLLLFALVVSLQPETVLEIGVSRGGSSALIAHAMDAIDKGRLFSIDPEPQVSETLAQSIAHRAVIHCGPSPADIRSMAQMAGTPFDFAFIDGDHSYQGVVDDINGVLECLADSAYLLFHDAYFHDVRDGIDAGLRQHGDVLQDCGILTHSPVRWAGNIDEADTIRYGGLRLVAFSRVGFPE